MIEAPNVQRLLKKPSSMMPSDLIRLWRDRPSIFARDVLDVTPYEWQREVMDLYVKHPRVAMLASKGPGKTWLLALMTHHFMITGYRPKAACLSITKDHLMANLWAELLKMRLDSPLLSASLIEGYDKIRLKGQEGFSFIDARSFPKQADDTQLASALAGHHADFVMFTIDEAGMIPDSILSTADAALSSGDSDTKRARILVSANPEEPRGTIYRAYKGLEGDRWKVYRVTSDPDDPKRAPRVSADFARAEIQKYGRDHPWVKITIFAEYPDSSSNQLLTDQEIRDSMERNVKEGDVSMSQMRLGIDVSRGGKDSTCFARRKGLMGYPLDMVSSEVMGPELAGKAVLMVEELGVERIFVDNTGGYGGSVVDSLSMFPSVDVTPVVYNAKAQDKRYFNKRTEMWVRMRDWVRKGGKLPNDPMLAEELQMPKLMFHGGVFRLEEKDQIRSRLGRSPDRADALAQTFADVEMPTSNMRNGALTQAATEGLPSWEIMKLYEEANAPKHLGNPIDIDKYAVRASNHRS